ncbi:type I polyketide synthase [Mesorhizobium sp. LHD-90]|uniref:type I polyketide synthase n=1 Tax=Mesorhizobium sp. LHD-90 TaxID=3071414 RepID=UPI0027DF84FE|nr:type I polyketide synthase [Mesorhizobium sp. LHD-90]MDQ6434985.1 type I polyketide synthase [Mesorhizobium sp. LHD-90]
MSVEIIGRAVRAPGADTPEQLFDLLRQRRCMITRVPTDRWDQSRYWHPEIGTRGKTYTFAAGIIDGCFDFDAAVFGLSQREAQLMDPQQRMILQLTWRALESANIDFADLRHQRVGVYVGASALDHGNLIVEDPAAAGPHFMTGNTLSIVSNRISHVFGLNGPSLTVDTACSSSLVALDLAMKALESGEVDTAIVGGVNALTHPLAFVGFAQARMLSPEGLCRAYDNDGMGYVRAEGGAVVILRRSDIATSQGDKSYGRVLASAVNSAGRTNGISLPSEKAQAQLLRSIYEGNGIDPNRLAFIEGHGTGTKVGDPAEIWSIGTVVGAARRAPIPIGSIKTNIGHTEPASGLLGLMKAMLALENNYFPASLHFETPNDAVDFNALNVHVAAEPIELLHGKHARLAGVNSFGFGGTNAHIIISDPQTPREREKPEAAGRVFLASAHTASALDLLLKSYRATLKDAAPSERRPLIAAAGANLHPLKHRFVVASDDPEAIVKAIDSRTRDRDSREAVQAEAIHDNAKIAFVFSGNGSQWAGMAIDAYRRNTAFRDRFNVIHALFQVRSQISLIDLLFDAELETKLQDTKIAQPLLFAIQAALADVLSLLGVKPDAVYGHSVGEVAAAYVSGAISLVDAVSVVAKRSYHQDRLAGLGRMAAIQLSPDDALAFVRRHGLDEIAIAAVNAKGSVTVSGPSEQIVALKEIMKAERVVGQVLDINYPFHHPLIEVAKDDFLDDMSQIALRPSQVPFISTVTGDVLSGNSLDPAYWWSNVREPVNFLGGTATALDMGCTLFVEIGPRPILTSYLRDTIKDRAVAASSIPSLTREESATDPVSTAYSRVLANGGVFDRRKAFGPRNARIALPALPFEPVPMRHEFTTDAIDLYGRLDAPHTLAGWRIDLSGGSWKNHIDAHLFPDLAEHVVDHKSILPGSAFLDIALSVARQFLGSDAIEVSNLEILRPLELSESHLRELSTTVFGDTGDVEIKSRDRLSSDDWTLHAMARCRKLSAAQPAPVAPAWKRVDTRIVSGATAYETAQQFGLDYGPTFRLMREASRTDDKRIDVAILPPEAPKNQHVGYSLHPVSVDAAFHGLVAMFGELSGDRRGAPYIPVRFGTARLYRPGATIMRAIINIERVSSGSIKAGFTLLDKAGEVVATLDDCRFKRTFLRQQKPLEDVSYHQTLVPSRLPTFAAGARAAVGGEPARFFPAPAESQGDSSSDMLQAAIYRASFEIARKTSRGVGVVAIDSLPGDLGFQRFLANGLYLLEEVGLAEQSEGNWTIEADCSLPSVPAILNAIYRERPDRIAEVVAVNDVYSEAMQRLDALHAPSAADARQDEAGKPKPSVISDTMLESLRVHSPASVSRVGRMLEALDAAVEARKATHPVRRIVELGTVSRSVTASLARIAAQAGAAFVAVEPRDAAFGELSIAFESNPHVTVVRPADLAQAGAVDVVVSAADHVFELLGSDGMSAAIASISGAGTQLLLCAPAPSAFSDFAFGLNDGWFSRSKGVEFPIGQLASSEDWQSLLRYLTFDDASVARHDLPHGPMITVEAVRRGEAGAVLSIGKQPALVLHDGRLPAKVRTALEDNGIGFLRFAGSADKDRAALTTALERFGEGDVTIVYLPEAAEGDGTERLQRSVVGLGLIAEVLRGLAATDASSRTLRLAVPASPDGAALHASASDAGLWAFLRVLRNEYEAIEVHSLDFSGVPGWSVATRIGRALALVSAGGDNREWAFDAATGEALEVRVVPGPVAESQALTSDFEAATVRQRVASQVASIAWQTTVAAEPGPDEIRIAVKATGLNFRDVMWAMGMLPEEALEDGFAGPTIGMECAGHIDAIGAGVTGFAIGDAVMAVAPAAFSTHVCVKRSGVAKLPAGVDPVAGATLPVAFLTAYYALVELARLRPGETVLVHGGAGGVGLAALQIAKAKGAKVIATAGSTEKRRLLETLGADHVFNSRTLEFVDDVLAVTGQVGVDIVLNSLFSEAMERSLSLLKPFGRFLELGKRDFYSDTKIGLRPFRRNVSYFGIDADQLLNTLPDLSASLLAEISTMFEKGDLAPLPYRAFRHDEIVGAFRLMQGSGHVGKIVVTAPVPGRDLVLTAPRSGLALDREGMHLVLGGIGGFGLAAANWLVEHGARNLALCSRRGVPDEATTAAMRKWSARGVATSVLACDITDEAAVRRMLDELRAQAPLKTVLHAAMVLDDGLIENLTEARVRAVVEPKAKAAAIFDRLTRQDEIDNFILFSSATTVVGNPGQANYVAANGYLEGLARARRRDGLPGLAIGFGAISDTGFLARNTEVNDILSKRIGKTGMTAAQALAYVEDYMVRDPGTVEAASVAIAEIDLAMARHLKTVATPLFAVVERSAKTQSSAGDGEMIDLVALVEGKSQEEGELLIFQLVAGEIAAILRVPVSDVSPLKVIKDVGLDSLMAMELGMSFRQKTGFEMPLSSVTQSTTVGDVARKLYLKITQRAGTDGSEKADNAVVDHLATRHTNPGKASA